MSLGSDFCSFLRKSHLYWYVGQITILVEFPLEFWSEIFRWFCSLFMPCPWIYTSFSKTLYLACADDDSRRKSDLIPFVYTATTTIYSNATLKLCPSVVFSSHHPTVNPICLRLCKLSNNHKPGLQFDFKGFFFVTEVLHSWTLVDSICISEILIFLCYASVNSLAVLSAGISSIKVRTQLGSHM